MDSSVVSELEYAELVLDGVLSGRVIKIYEESDSIAGMLCLDKDRVKWVSGDSIGADTVAGMQFIGRAFKAVWKLIVKAVMAVVNGLKRLWEWLTGGKGSTNPDTPGSVYEEKPTPVGGVIGKIQAREDRINTDTRKIISGEKEASKRDEDARREEASKRDEDAQPFLPPTDKEGFFSVPCPRGKRDKELDHVLKWGFFNKDGEYIDYHKDHIGVNGDVCARTAYAAINNTVARTTLNNTGALVKRMSSYFDSGFSLSDAEERYLDAISRNYFETSGFISPPLTYLSERLEEQGIAMPGELINTKEPLIHDQLIGGRVRTKVDYVQSIPTWSFDYLPDTYKHDHIYIPVDYVIPDDPTDKRINRHGNVAKLVELSEVTAKVMSGKVKEMHKEIKKAHESNEDSLRDGSLHEPGYAKTARLTKIGKNDRVASAITGIISSYTSSYALGVKVLKHWTDTQLFIATQVNKHVGGDAS